MRATVWDLSSRSHDLLVIGGGATGAGIAREAALRGLAVALVDRQDFAGGTSSRSSRLIHGGLRYLEHRRWRLVRESLTERRILLHLAPHLVRRLSFLFPIFRGDRVARWRLEAGLTLYDLLAARGNVPRHRALSKRAVLDHEPLLRERGLTGGALYWDAQCDDARLTLATVRSAARAGAMVANHACVTAFEIQNGRITGAAVEDQLTGAQATIRARLVVNATGPWVDAVRRLEDPAAYALLRPTRGAHVMVPRARLGHTNGITFLSPIDGRVMFVLPWGDRSYIGTTDTDAEAEPDRVSATDGDMLYLLRSANAIFPGARLGPEDVSMSWAGLRPLVTHDRAGTDGAGPPGSRSREHAIETGPRGLLTIAGGKLTTYRRMAVELVDAAARILARGSAMSTNPDRTRSAMEALPGGEPVDRSFLLALGVKRGLPESTVAHLVGQYGSEVPAMFALLDEHADLTAPVHPHHGAIGAEVVYAVRREYARRLDDVLFRRLSLAFETPDAGAAAVPEIARLMARELGWDESRRGLEVERYSAIVSAVPKGRGLSSG